MATLNDHESNSRWGLRISAALVVAVLLGGHLLLASVGFVTMDSDMDGPAGFWRGSLDSLGDVYRRFGFGRSPLGAILIAVALFGTVVVLVGPKRFWTGWRVFWEG